VSDKRAAGVGAKAPAAATAAATHTARSVRVDAIPNLGLTAQRSKACTNDQNPQSVSTLPK
jgi:hypothetical protein